MEKALSLLLVLLLVPSLALGAVLSDGWQDASLDDLLAAQQELAAQVSALRAAQVQSVDKISLSGSGTSILTDVTIPFSPARVTFTGKGTASLDDGGSYAALSMKADTYEVEAFSKEGTYTLMVEASGDWSFVVEPIVPGASLPMSGEGPFVSDFFDLSAPAIVTLSADSAGMSGRLSNFIVKFSHPYSNISGWTYDILSNELLHVWDKFSADVIIKPTKGKTEYFFIIACEPGVKWEILGN